MNTSPPPLRVWGWTTFPLPLLYLWMCWIYETFCIDFALWYVYVGLCGTPKFGPFFFLWNLFWFHLESFEFAFELELWIFFLKGKLDLIQNYSPNLSKYWSKHPLLHIQPPHFFQQAFFFLKKECPFSLVSKRNPFCRSLDPRMNSYDLIYSYTLHPYQKYPWSSGNFEHIHQNQILSRFHLWTTTILFLALFSLKFCQLVHPSECSLPTKIGLVCRVHRFSEPWCHSLRTFPFISPCDSLIFIVFSCSSSNSLPFHDDRATPTICPVLDLFTIVWNLGFFYFIYKKIGTFEVSITWTRIKK